MKNREIKFRAWLYGKMHNDIGLHPFIAMDHTKCDEDDFTHVPKGTERGELTLYTSGSSSGIMQFTGLHDKNGKEIYEGDIVSITNDFGYSELATIEYGLDNMAAFCYRYCKDNFILAASDIAACDTKVIGNIYQHPELLK